MFSLQKPSLRRAVAIAVFQIGMVTFYYQDLTLLMIALLVSVLFLLWQFRFSLSTLIIFGVFALAGVLAEGMVVTRGAWSYADQHFFGLPVWLPLIWGSVGVAGMRLTQLVQQRYGT